MDWLNWGQGLVCACKVPLWRKMSWVKESWTGPREAPLPLSWWGRSSWIGTAHKECFPPLPHNLSHHFLLARLIQITSKHVTVAFGMPAQTTPPSLGTNTSLSFRALEPDWPYLVIAEETWPRSWTELIRIFFLLQIWKCDSEKEDL